MIERCISHNTQLLAFGFGCIGCTNKFLYWVNSLLPSLISSVKYSPLNVLISLKYMTPKYSSIQFICFIYTEVKCERDFLSSIIALLLIQSGCCTYVGVSLILPCISLKYFLTVGKIWPSISSRFVSIR